MDKRSCRRRLLSFTSGLMLLTAVFPVWADSGPFNGLRAVPDAELAQMRGGYITAGGIEVTFGIEAAVFIDGVLQAVTSLNAASADLGLSDPHIVARTGVDANIGLTLVNRQLTMSSMDIDAVRSQLTTVVQNSQDHKIIDNIIQFNAVVSSLDAFRQGRFLDSLQQQMVTASP